jgi:hypothetical protein
MFYNQLTRKETDKKEIDKKEAVKKVTDKKEIDKRDKDMKFKIKDELGNLLIWSFINIFIFLIF